MANGLGKHKGEGASPGRPDEVLTLEGEVHLTPVRANAPDIHVGVEDGEKEDRESHASF